MWAKLQGAQLEQLWGAWTRRAAVEVEGIRFGFGFGDASTELSDEQDMEGW